MGDPELGRAIAQAADAARRDRQPGERAIQILDRICQPHERSAPDFRAVDPDHPDRPHPKLTSYCDPHPDAALGMLIVEAFAPTCMPTLADHQRSPDSHWRGVVRKFYVRYKFDTSVAVACTSCGLSNDGIDRLARDPLSRAMQDVAAAARHIELGAEKPGYDRPAVDLIAEAERRLSRASGRRADLVQAAAHLLAALALDDRSDALARATTGSSRCDNLR